MGKLKPTRKEYKAENNRLKEKIKRLEARMDVKYLHKLEKKNRDLGLIIKTKELHILDLNKKIVGLRTKIVQEESFSAKLERKNKELKRKGKKK